MRTLTIVMLVTLLVTLLPMMAQADTGANKQLVRMKELEKALRMQNVTILAVRQGNYDLACKSQKEATQATLQAHVIDINMQSQMQYAELCNESRSLANTVSIHAGR